MRILEKDRREIFAQFDTFRSFIMALSTVVKVYIKVLSEGGYMGQEPRREAVLTKCITQTIWSERFASGVAIRVGSKSSSYQDISINKQRY